MQKEANAIATVKPATSYKWIENGHILLWLIKDTCWATVWKPGGIFMIVPTIGVALYILWRSMGNRAEFYHNASICFWIAANSIWMVGEFFNKDLRPVAVCFFASGLIVLIVYYLLYFKKDRKKELETAIG